MRPCVALGCFFLLLEVAPLPAQSDFTVSSPAVSGAPQIGFDSHLRSTGRIDGTYAAGPTQGANHRSFPFFWKDLPVGTKALALILDDPDARLVLAARGIRSPAFVHWLAADIDPSLGGLPDNASADHPTFSQGKNGRGEIGYTGPQPPSDVPAGYPKPLIHVYRLTVYALSAPTGLANGFSLEDLQAAVQGKTLGVGRYLFSYSELEGAPVRERRGGEPRSLALTTRFPAASQARARP